MSEKNNTKSETNSKFREGLNELLKQTKSFIFEEAQSIILFLIALLLLFLFEDETKALFYDKVLPVLNRMNFGIVSWSILSLLGIFHLHYVWQCVKNSYRISVFSFLLITLVIILLFNGLLLDYSSIEIRVLIFLLLVAILCFWIFSFINFFPCQSAIGTQAEKEKFLSIDTPIKNKEDDRLGFSEDINLLISKLPKETEQAYSVGIVGSWGSGKTSYLNLLEKKLNKEQFIVIKFNPRHSLNACTIQEDFFHELFSTLKKYDSRFSSSFKDYLKAINIIGENKFLSSFLSIHQLWNSGREKQKISEAIKRLGKRVVVFIDDFDRLLREEVIEVLKLIDGNASFSNMIFFAAYDKQHLNKILVSENTSETKLFSDKYFSIEQSVPSLSNEFLWERLKKILPENHSKDIKFNRLSAPSSELYFELDKILPTLRDLKRFSNSFKTRYETIKDEILFGDYFLLQIVRYCWEKEYFNIKRKDYLYFEDGFWRVNDPAISEIKKNTPLFAKVLSLLFLTKEYKEKNRTIANDRVYNTYFYETFSEKFFLILLNTTLEGTSDFKEIIDSWIDRGYGNSILNSLRTIEQNIKTKEVFSRLLFVLIYLQNKLRYCNNSNLTSEINRILSEYYKTTPPKEIYTLLFNENRIEYKSFIKEKIKTLDSTAYVKCAMGIFEDLNEKPLSNYENMSSIPLIESNSIFSREEAHEIMKDAFLELIKVDPEIGVLHTELLNVYTGNDTDNPKPLDGEMLKVVIETLDQYESSDFFNNLYEISDQEFTLNPFFELIFENKEALGSFLMSRKYIPDHIKYFWRLYSSNNYKDLILSTELLYLPEKKVLERAYEDLKKIEEIESQLDDLEKTASLNRTSVQKLIEDLSSIKLKISKHSEVFTKLNEKRRKLLNRGSWL